ncbi:SusC/RagA family TonB-linked outer membrane protein [Chitinophaga cymbidii]|uniref:SusC/RagA family TonB-linked outer membrane protein n=1 Tax=Chitinophaga cymbidii TaxID=1096750 RepID=A0A512RRL1_9BACT|nr:TonB-dependent receptor [Chitinophaga cymbidii]GEP98316.1 SusC/RagA family TonB-linked outer membrane protein [Chitinophaga cymbidii]
MKYCLTIIAILLTGLTSLAQQRKVTGTVTEKSTGTPLPGVSVQATNNSVISDSTGRFSITAAAGEILTFTYIGMKPSMVKVPASGDIQVALDKDASNLNEVVVTGYQAQKKADLTGAVSVVDVEAIKDIPLGNPVKALQGRVPGVLITSDGSPSGGATVRIRGIGTLGNNDPLYVIDGVPTKRGLQELNQDDIESIQVLKDASSATIYGSRAANGVIIVTTKKARKGFTRVDFDASTSLQYYATKQKTLDADGRGKAYWQAAVNDRTDPNNNQIYQYDWNGDYDNPVLNNIVYPDFIDADQTMRPANTYWYDEIAQTSVIQQYNVSVSTGGERGSALFSLGYYDNKGVVKESNNKKITARLNSDYSFFKNRLKIGENLNFSYIRNRLIPISDVLFTSLVQQPVVPVHTVDGGWGGPAPGMTDRHNPVRLIEDNKQNLNHFYRVFGNVYADLDIIPGLHFRTSLGIDYNGNYQRTLRKSYVSGFLSDPSNQTSTNQGYDGNWLWQNTLNYKLDLGQHRFEFLAGHEQIKYMNQSFFASRQGYALENIDYAYIDAGSSNKDNGGGGSGYALLSFFGKANYVYADRYLASVTLRRDGSSRFGKEYRYGVFPAFSVGWRVSEEAFMKDQDIISDLKFRYGWGKSGNQEIANNATYALYASIYGVDPTWGFDSGSAYDINGSGSGQLPSGFTRIQQGNDSLKWETTMESNFGVDFGLFDNKLTGSVDYFIKKTSDILISPGYLAVQGEGGNYWFNGASMQNKGLEVLLSYNGNISRELSFTVTGNFSTYRNKVTYLPVQVLTSYPGNGTDKTILGRSINSSFGYIADGLFTSQKELDESPAQTGKGLGRIRYRDLNGDNVIDDKDRDYIADGNPDFLYGLNFELSYKNFDLSFFLQGVQGIQVYNEFKTFTDFSSLWVGSNWGERTLSAWTPSNPTSTIPALTLVNRNNEGRASTYFYEDGSYLKLRNIQLGYNLRQALRNTSIQNARVFLQASNLLTFKNKGFTAADPEAPGQSFPIPVIVTAGFNVSL